MNKKIKNDGNPNELINIIFSMMNIIRTSMTIHNYEEQINKQLMEKLPHKRKIKTTIIEVPKSIVWRRDHTRIFESTNIGCVVDYKITYIFYIVKIL